MARARESRKSSIFPLRGGLTWPLIGAIASPRPPSRHALAGVFQRNPKPDAKRQSWSTYQAAEVVSQVLVQGPS